MKRLKAQKMLKSVSEHMFSIKRKNYGEWWQKRDSGFYSAMYDNNPKIHDSFLEWLRTTNGVNTVLEVGCGNGFYGSTTFKNTTYDGIDISEPAIALAKSKDVNSNHSYRANDFIIDPHYTGDARFDLVFSHSVIDHVYDVESFIVKCISNAKKYVYISAYFGYHPDLQSHECTWNDGVTCYHNKLSVPRLEKLLDSLNVKYTIKSLYRGPNNTPQLSTIIIIEKS